MVDLDDEISPGYQLVAGESHCLTLTNRSSIILTKSVRQKRNLHIGCWYGIHNTDENIAQYSDYNLKNSCGEMSWNETFFPLMQGVDIPLQKHHPFTLAHAHFRGVWLRSAHVTLYKKNTLLLLESEQSINVMYRVLKRCSYSNKRKSY